MEGFDSGDVLIFAGMVSCGYMGYRRTSFNAAFGMAGVFSIAHLIATFIVGTKQTPPVYLSLYAVALLAVTFLTLFSMCWWIGTKLPDNKQDQS